MIQIAGLIFIRFLMRKGIRIVWVEIWRMIRNMKEMGMSNRDIAKELGVSRNTVSQMLKKTRIQDKKRGTKLDPYKERIRSLIEEHNLSGVKIL